MTQAGYVQQPDRSYLRKALAKLKFKYTEVRVHETVHEIDPESVRNLPVGVDGTRYRWVDLDSVGLDGVLSEQADAWYYKRISAMELSGQRSWSRPGLFRPRSLVGGNCSISLVKDTLTSFNSTARWQVSVNALRREAGSRSRGLNPSPKSIPETLTCVS